MGFLLPSVFRGLKKIGKSVLVIAGATIMIEVSQYIAGVGTADIDDVLLNLIGGIVGFSIYHIVKIFVSKMQKWIDGNI